MSTTSQSTSSKSSSPEPNRQDTMARGHSEQGGGLAAPTARERGRSRSEPIPRAAEHQYAHTALICVAAPHLAVSSEHGQLTGSGMEGIYCAGRRVVSRCQLLIGGLEPVPLQGRMINAAQARFISSARTIVGHGPDPEIVVERLRSADGGERISVRNAGGRPVRLPVELRMGTDLAEISAIAVGKTGPELTASVHGSGLSWTAEGLRASVAVEPQPDTVWAGLGLMKWDWELEPGDTRTIVLSTELAQPPADTAPGGKRAGRSRAPDPREVRRPPRVWHGARAGGEDRRVAALFRAALDDANALLMVDETVPSDLHMAAGVPWRCALAPADSLRAARMLLPLGTRLAAGTLRTLARSQLTEPGRNFGRLPGALRDAGPYAPPSCTGTEATLLFPTVLAEAWRWGLPESETEQLLPAAERCLQWMLRTAEDDIYVADPAPDGPFRCEVQAGAHRAALIGAELLDACGGDGGSELRDWAAAMRGRFQKEFWHEDGRGGRPLALITPSGAAKTYLGCAAVELLDTGLAGGGRPGDGLLTTPQTEQLCRLLSGPHLDSGWGLRSLDDREERHNPFGHRSGAVRAQESVTAVAGLAAAGHEQEAASLLRGVLDAAGVFGLRLPEMYAVEPGAATRVPLPHPAACRPAAVAAAGVIQLLITLAGVRPDVPGGAVCVRPLAPAPLGAVEFTGLRIAGGPFSVRVSSDGTGSVGGAARALRPVG